MIVGHLKQARDGCEHLKPQLSVRKMPSGVSSDAESQRHSTTMEETQQKYFQMWSEILDLATIRWEDLIKQHAGRNVEFRKANEKANKLLKQTEKKQKKLKK
jgi:hypothetical protein